MWYMHDGAPAYFSPAVRYVLNNTYYYQFIAGGRTTAWPPNFPNLNPLDIYLWGHLKTLVYAAPVDSEESFHHGIVDACHTICNYPGIFERMRRVEVCIESHGGHFEHLLQMYFFSDNTQIKCFQTCCYGHFFLFSCVELMPNFVHTFQLHLVYIHACIHTLHRSRICQMTIIYAYFISLVERNSFILIYMFLAGSVI
jgi:hypothetical protein